MPYSGITPQDEDIGNQEAYSVQCVAGYLDTAYVKGDVKCERGKLTKTPVCAGM